MATQEQGIGAQALAAWIGEAECILSAAAIVVRHFEGADAFDAFEACMVVPRGSLQRLKQLTRDGPSVELPMYPLSGEPKVLQCGSELALILTGLLLPIVEPVPQFLGLLRTPENSPQRYDVIKRAYGVFIGELSSSICYPLWEKFPHTKPSGASR